MLLPEVATRPPFMAVLIPITKGPAYSMDLIRLAIAPSASKEAADKAPSLFDWEAEKHRIAKDRSPEVRFKMAPIVSLRKSPLFEAAAIVIKVAACMLALNK